MSFVPYPWQQQTWDALVERHRLGRLPHALLFAGPDGVGKAHLADLLARWQLCESHEALPCGHCRGCHLLAAGNHPDLLRVEPEDQKEITIDQVRAITEFQTLKPQYARDKIVLLFAADRLNSKAANALLKTLEEPASGTSLILVTHRLWSLLPTIRSRCQAIRFPIPEDAVARQWLASQLPADTDLRLVHALAGGAPLRALRLAEAGIEGSSGAIQSLDGLARGQTSALEIAGHWATSGAEAMLAWFALTLSDLIRIKSVGASVEPVQFQQTGRLQALAERVDLLSLFRLLDRVQESGRLLRGHANATLVLEELLIYWTTLFNRRASVKAR